MKMTPELATEVFTLSIERQRIENRMYEIRKQLSPNPAYLSVSWDDVSTAAMKLKMEEALNVKP